MNDRTYLEAILMEFKRLRLLSDAAFSQLEDAELFQETPHHGDSVATLIKHMSGNMLSRWRDFLTTDGEKADRDRDSEFVITEADSRQALDKRWEAGWECLFGALDPLNDTDMSRTVLIRGEPHTVLQAINRQLAHYAYHTGQIVLLAKGLRGSAWTTLSVAKGKSQAFNEDPASYLSEGISGRETDDESGT